jgi:phosphopantothenoylcysteine decarboxylase
LAEVQAALLAKLWSARVKDEAFIKRISTMAETLGASVAEEQIETTFTRDGKRVTEIVDIGKRIVQFKKSVDKESARLEEYWRQWADLQNEYVELGVEVLGPKLFKNHEVEGIEADKGFRKEMELLDLEHTSRVEELTAEVDDITSKILKKMKASEKVGFVCMLFPVGC